MAKDKKLEKGKKLEKKRTLLTPISLPGAKG